MIKTQLPAALRALGFSDQEIAHMLRVGGPLDDICHRTWCDRCERSAEKSLRQLLLTDVHCTCGGNFHIGRAGHDIVAEVAGRLAPGAASHQNGTM